MEAASAAGDRPVKPTHRKKQSLLSTILRGPQHPLDAKSVPLLEGNGEANSATPTTMDIAMHLSHIVDLRVAGYTVDHCIESEPAMNVFVKFLDESEERCLLECLIAIDKCIATIPIDPAAARQLVDTVGVIVVLARSLSCILCTVCIKRVARSIAPFIAGDGVGDRTRRPWAGEDSSDGVRRSSPMGLAEGRPAVWQAETDGTVPRHGATRGWRYRFRQPRLQQYAMPLSHHVRADLIRLLRIRPCRYGAGVADLGERRIGPPDLRP